MGRQTRRWCFADQLGPHFLDAPGQPVSLVESRAAFERRRFRRRKAHLVLSALRHRAAEHGDRACPFTGGYWWFLDRNSARLANNRRMNQPLAGLRRLRNLDEVVAQRRLGGHAR